MISAGRVLLMPKGDYDATVTYEMLDIVSYNGSSYVAKGTTTGNLPTNTTYWQLSAYGGESASLAGDFAPLETTDYASKAYAVDDIFVDKNSQLVIATSTINIGDEIVVGSNCEATTIAELLSDIEDNYDALDQRNRKLVGINPITIQTDLHLLAPGEYFKKLTNIYVTNAPTGIDSVPTAVFRLTVESGLDESGSSLVLTLRTLDGKTYTQAYDGSSWSAWAEISSKAYVDSQISGLGTAASKDSTNAVTSGSTDLVESGAVYSAVGAESTARANADNEFTSEIADMNNILGSKNLLNLPASKFPAVQYGITVQKNSDGSLSISGTNPDNTRHGITIYSGDLDEGSKLQIGTSYTLNGVKSTDGCFLQIGGIDNGTYTNWGETNSEAGLEFEATASEFRVYLIIPPNGSVNGTIYPMVRPASLKSAVYAPYAKTNKELTDSVKETNDLFTPVRVLSTSYNGLNIEVYKSLNNHAIRINISGTITTAIPIASAYVAIADISNLDLGRLDSYILFNSSVGGQIRVNRPVSGSSNGKIELGYARKFSEDSTIDLPVGMSIFITLSFIK